MATIKSYTDLDQSKKLAKILQTKSADMFCAEVFNKEEETHSYNFHILSTWGCNTFEELKDRENKFVRFIPCWSLAALLGVLPSHFYDKTERKALGMDKGDTYFNIFYENKNSYIQKSADNPVDACVAMIEKLHELNLL